MTTAFVVRRSKSSDASSAMATAPGMTYWVPLSYGRLWELLHEPLGFLPSARERHGDVFRVRMGPLVSHFVFHPDHVRRVLHDRQKNYLRGWHYRLLRSLAGDNLVVNDGEPWLRQRRLAQPAFHRQRHAGFAEVMVDATARMLDRWSSGSTTSTVNIGAEMSRLALEIAGRTLFSRDVSGETDSVGRAFAIVGQYLKQRLDHPLTSPPTWVPTPTNRRFKKAVRDLNAIVVEIIRQRRREARDRGDLLSTLMQAQDDETGTMLNDGQLCSTVLAFMLAGHETTATALTWTWYLLASHPAIRQRVRDEAEAAFGSRSPALADVSQLDTTRMVIEESMRLYPPIWVLPRQVVADDEIGGFRIPARSTVLICPFVTHRHPAVWDRPETFDPDRFTPERSAERSKYAFFPFIAGPHQCIGSEFAMLEMRLIVAMVLQKFDIELLPNQSIEPRASITIRPSTPVQIVLTSVARPDDWSDATRVATPLA